MQRCAKVPLAKIEKISCDLQEKARTAHLRKGQDLISSIRLSELCSLSFVLIRNSFILLRLLCDCVRKTWANNFAVIISVWSWNANLWVRKPNIWDLGPSSRSSANPLDPWSDSHPPASRSLKWWTIYAHLQWLSPVPKSIDCIDWREMYRDWESVPVDQHGPVAAMASRPRP